MQETFVVTAIPKLLPEGPDKGHLESVQFVATDGFHTEKWWSTNVGSYVDDFSNFMPRTEASAIMHQLQNGEPVILPGFWTLDQVKHKFGGVGNE